MRGGTPCVAQTTEVSLPPSKARLRRRITQGDRTSRWSRACARQGVRQRLDVMTVGVAVHVSDRGDCHGLVLAFQSANSECHAWAVDPADLNAEALWQSAPTLAAQRSG